MAGNKLFAGLPDGLPDDAPQNPENLPPELKGKSTEEVYDMLRQENERLLQEQEQKLKAQNFDKMQQDQQVQQSQQQAPYYTPPSVSNYGGYGNQGQQGQQGQQSEPDMYSDPEGFMDRQLQRRLGPVMQSTLESMKATNKQMFIQQVGQEEWNKYGSEIEQFVNALSSQAQMNPAAFTTAYNYVRSTHIDEITESKAEKMAEERVRERLDSMGIDPSHAAGTQGSEEQRLKQAMQSAEQEKPRSSLFQRDTGTMPQNYGRPTGNGNGSSGRKSKLTDQEKRLAEQFDMSEDEYMDYKKFNTDIYAGMEDR